MILYFTGRFHRKHGGWSRSLDGCGATPRAFQRVLSDFAIFFFSLHSVHHGFTFFLQKHIYTIHDIFASLVPYKKYVYTPISPNSMNVPEHRHSNPVVTSAESSSEDSDAEQDWSEQEEEQEQNTAGNKTNQPTGDEEELYYDNNADDEDEAYVYKNLRSGTTEAVTIQNNASSSSSHQAIRTETIQAYKPRHSDAVLSCPCCFVVVCMDCQRHERYQNQFRAMFVMNTNVNMQETWKFNDLQQGLVKTNQPAAAAAVSVSVGVAGTVVPCDVEEQVVYHTVNCANCQTQVAVFDRMEEVYHFTGCLAST